MSPRTIYMCKRITLYFLIILLFAMLFNMVTGAIELMNDTSASSPWYAAVLAVAAIYSVPVIILLVAHLFFRSRAKRLEKGKPFHRDY